jgi:5-methylthioadenosine/S-adenosylhomocysteine deaminase
MSDQGLLLKNGYVVTMDPDTGDVPGADVRVRDGAIHEIGAGLEPSGGESVIDATDKVVLPGLVDTHRHLWRGRQHHLAIA